MSTSFGVKTEIWENVANSAVHKATRKSVTGDKEDAEARWRHPNNKMKCRQQNSLTSLMDKAN